MKYVGTLISRIFFAKYLSLITISYLCSTFGCIRICRIGFYFVPTRPYLVKNFLVIEWGKVEIIFSENKKRNIWDNMHDFMSIIVSIFQKVYFKSTNSGHIRRDLYLYWAGALKVLQIFTFTSLFSITKSKLI